jgi:hypothetical protein
MRRFLLISAVLPCTLMAQPKAAPLQPGEAIPDSMLKTDAGEVVALRELVSEKPAFEKLNHTLLSDSSMDAARSFGIAFEVPAELVSKYKSQYGIDIEAASGQAHHLLPHPAVYVVGTDGIIRFAYVNEDYKVRLEPEKILETIKSQ